MFIAIKHLKENIWDLKNYIILLIKQYSWHSVKMYPFQRQYWYKNIKYLPERKTNYACSRETRKWGFLHVCGEMFHGLEWSEFLFGRINWWWRWARTAYLPRKWWAVPWEMRWNTVLVSESLLLTFLLVCDWQWNYCPHTGTNTSGPVCNPQDSWEEEAKKLLFFNTPKQSRIHQDGSNHSRQWASGEALQ